MYKNELQQVIRFNISQLSAQNSSSDFEKICLFFSRARIHINVLPATGPVQAGGDQGRDFETFHTYLATIPKASSLFVGNFSKYPVAFACSLEKEPIRPKGKIYQDVKSIMASGSKVERIYFFSGEDIPVSKRHSFQSIIKKEFQVELEIIDANALSQQLCDSDLFWIATQYLKIPLDCYPQNNDETWYTKLLSEYRVRDKTPETFEEFAEIKAAVRHIYKDAELKKDLLFWLPWFDRIIQNEGVVESLVRYSIYEKFVASLIGLNNIDGQENNLCRYFNSIGEYTANSELSDTQILLSFCYSSKAILGHNLSIDYLDRIATQLEMILLEKIHTTESVDSKCELIEVHAALIPHIDKGEPKLRFQKQFDRQMDMLPLLAKTHFYPIERLVDRTNEMIKRLIKLPIDISSLEDFARKLDELLSKKGGREIVAAKLRERAGTYLENKEVNKAIEVLHEFKLNSFKHDTLDGTILSCLLLCNCYRQLNMHFAAKHYAFVAAFLAVKSRDVTLYHRTVSAISMAADEDYAMGSWLHFLDLIDFLLLLHYRVTKDFDIYDDDDTHRILYYPCVAIKVAEKFFPKLQALIDSRMEGWGFIKEDIYEYKEKLDANEEFNDEVKLRAQLAEQIDGRIFNDVGEYREISFNALGCDWFFKFSNEYNVSALAEQFIAMIQISIVDVFKDELYIIPTKINIEIGRSSNQKATFERVESNNEMICKVALPEFRGSKLEQLQDNEFHYFVVIQHIFHEISILPFEEYKKILGQKFANNLFAKLTFGRPYAELYKHFILEKTVDTLARHNIPNEFYLKGYNPKENTKLKWRDSLAHKYDREKSLQAINNRMSNLVKPISMTLPKLKQSSEFRKVVENLRAKGYLDWHILHCIATIIVNYKAQFRSGNMSIKQLKNMAMDYFMKDEGLWYVEIPLSILSEEKIEQEINFMFSITMLPGFGLESHSQTPDGKAILKLLKHRFNFFEDGKEILVF